MRRKARAPATVESAAARIEQTVAGHERQQWRECESADAHFDRHLHHREETDGDTGVRGRTGAKTGI